MRVVNALVYAVIVGLGAVVTAGKIPEDIVSWCGLALAVVTAGWGKYTQDSSLLSANRTPWTEQERSEKATVETEDQRRVRQGLPPKRPPVA